MRHVKRYVYSYKKLHSISRKNSKCVINGMIGGREAAILIHKSFYVLFLDSTYYPYDADEISLRNLFSINLEYLESGKHPDYNPGFEVPFGPF